MLKSLLSGEVCVADLGAAGPVISDCSEINKSGSGSSTRNIYFSLYNEPLRLIR